jgi:hypothetical protein
MTLYTRAVQTLASLAADEEASASSEVLERGMTVSSQLDAARDTLGRAQELAQQLAVGPLRADVKAATKALAGLDQGLSRHGFTALQHKSTSKAVEEAKNLQRTAEKWAAAAWGQALSDISPILTRARSAELHGSWSAITKVRNSARRLTAALALNPLTDLQRLAEQFDGGDIPHVVVRLREQADALASALDDLESEHAALSESIRAVFEQAKSEDGLPLSAMTRELLDELREAGVIDRLTVRSE